MPSLIDVPGLLVGQAQDLTGYTGLAVVLVPDGAVGGVSLQGGATATRQTDRQKGEPRNIETHLKSTDLKLHKGVLC
jgi:L-aminopeptidase/D-esterase-like protein